VLVVGGWTGYSILTDVEIYDPATGTWSTTSPLTTARCCHTATLLPDGRVLVAAGQGSSEYLGSVEVYDPASGMWSATGALAFTRRDHTATLLLDGRVLITGGRDSVDFLDSSEIYDRGLGFEADWRPILTTATSPVTTGVDKLQISGSGFRGVGYTEASGGNFQNSASNYPLVQLRRLDNGQLRWLWPDPTSGFSATSFTSLPITDFQGGPALLTVFVNGIPSQSKIISVIYKNHIYLPLLLRRP
jgi:hypothetical protein